jgi:hypothetical protein
MYARAGPAQTSSSQAASVWTVSTPWGPTSHPPASAADRTLDEAGHLGSPSICWVEREVAR